VEGLGLVSVVVVAVEGVAADAVHVVVAEVAAARRGTRNGCQ